MLQLQRHLGALLREFAILKCVRELRLLSNADQKLRLGEQCHRLESALQASRADRREGFVGGGVLVAWGFVRGRAGGGVTGTYYSVAMASRQLLFPRVAVVDRDEEASLTLKDLCDALHPLQGRQRSFHPLALFRMNTVAIEKFDLRFGWRNERFHEFLVLQTNSQPAPMVHHLDGKSVEEFVAEDDHVFARRRSRRLERLEDMRPFCRHVLGQPFLQSSAQMRRLLHQRVTQREREVRKLLCRPIQHIAREQAASGTQFDDINALRRTQGAPHLLELPRQQPPKHRMNVAGSVKVPGSAELLVRARVVAKLGLIETHLHVARERHWAIAANLVGDALAQARFATSAALRLLWADGHSLPSRSICWCSLRCCGVRTNISTR